MAEPRRPRVVVIGLGVSTTLIAALLLTRGGADYSREPLEDPGIPGPPGGVRVPAGVVPAALSEEAARGAEELVRSPSPVERDDSPRDAQLDSSDPLAVAQESLCRHATDALYGKLLLDEVMDDLLALASLPISEHPDFDYEDDDALAYDFVGAPAGAEVRMLVGLQPYYENDRVYRYLQMEVDAPREPEFLDGAMRAGPNVHLSISYDVEEPGDPTRFALMLQRDVDLAASRDQGIDAFSGRYSTGAYYWHDLKDPSKEIFASTIGISNGNPVSPPAFDGAPLQGRTDLDMTQLESLLTQLQSHLSLIKGESK